MKRHLVRKSYRVEPDQLANAKRVLGAASESEAVRMAIQMVIDHEETMELARKVMKERSGALRQLARYDREAEIGEDE